MLKSFATALRLRRVVKFSGAHYEFTYLLTYKNATKVAVLRRCTCIQPRRNNTTRLSSNLRPTTSECVHLHLHVVTSGHVTKMAVIPFYAPKPKTPCCTQTSWLVCFIEPELLPIEVPHCGRHTACTKMNFLLQGFRK